MENGRDGEMAQKKLNSGQKCKLVTKLRDY